MKKFGLFRNLLTPIRSLTFGFSLLSVIGAVILMMPFSSINGYNAIQNGRFKPGERLPSVEQLAAELNVGRSSVREALRTLQARGVITVKHGKGSFITAPRLHLGSVLMSFSEYIRRRGKVPGSLS